MGPVLQEESQFRGNGPWFEVVTSIIFIEVSSKVLLITGKGSRMSPF